MPTCPGCGDDFGNEGALATHKNSCDELQQNPRRPKDPPQQPRRPQGGQQARAPAPAQNGQPGGQPPAPQNTEQAAQTGITIADAITGMQSGDPAERAESKGTIMKSLGVAIAKVGERTEQREKRAVETARGATSDDLQQSQDYPECPECGGQITRIPETEFGCPHCGTRLEYDPAATVEG